MRFIYCFDDKLKQQLIKCGYRLLKEQGVFSIFANESSTKFNFNEVNQSDFKFSNTMTF